MISFLNLERTLSFLGIEIGTAKLFEGWNYDNLWLLQTCVNFWLDMFKLGQFVHTEGRSGWGGGHCGPVILTRGGEVAAAVSA